MYSNLEEQTMQYQKHEIKLGLIKLNIFGSLSAGFWTVQQALS